MISVIVPIYNVEDYLNKCLTSIMMQTYRDLEIIMVNDGSTDKSADICKFFCKKDSRFKLINQKNSGVSVARNTGIKNSHGEYISFVDADDYLEVDMYQKLMNEYTNDEIDLVCCGIYRVNNEKKIKDFTLRKKIIIGKDEFLRQMFKIKKRKICWAPWNKLFKTKIVKKIMFPIDIKIGEDMLFLYEYIKQSQKIILTTDILYNYLIRNNSATNTKNFSMKKFDIIRVYDRLLDNCDEKQKDILNLRLFIVSLDVLFKYLKLLDSIQDESIEKFSSYVYYEKINNKVFKYFFRLRIRQIVKYLFIKFHSNSFKKLPE